MEDKRVSPPESDAPAVEAGEPQSVRPILPREDEGSGGGIVSALQNVAGPVAGVIGSVIEAAGQVWGIGDGAVGRRLRRQAREPLASL